MDRAAGGSSSSLSSTWVPTRSYPISPAGVAHVWLVNPRTYTLEVLRLENTQWVVPAAHDGDVSVRVEPFDALVLDLFRLWGRSEPEGE